MSVSVCVKERVFSCVESVAPEYTTIVIAVLVMIAVWLVIKIATPLRTSSADFDAPYLVGGGNEPMFLTFPTPAYQLTEDNFDFWFRKLSVELEERGLDDAIKSSVPTASLKNRLALDLILDRVPERFRNRIGNEVDSAREAVCILRDNFGQKSAQKQKAIESRIGQMRLMKFDEASIDDHLKEFEEAITKLSDAGGDVSQQNRSFLLAETMPTGRREYTFFASSLRNSFTGGWNSSVIQLRNE